MKEWTIYDIEALTEAEAARMATDAANIKGHRVYFVDFGGAFGYSALVFRSGRHIYHANLYQLHYRNIRKTVEEFKQFYIDKLNNTLFTDDEFAEDLKDYDEYRCKEEYLRNKYSQQIDYVSIFSAGDTDTTGLIFDPVGFCYTADTTFVNRHKALYQQLKEAKQRAQSTYSYMVEAFLTEMFNHEYGINWQADYDVLSVFGNIEYSEDGNALDTYFNALNFSDMQKKAYLEARNKYYNQVNI